MVIFPGEAGIDYLGGLVHSLWLEFRSRIGAFFVAVQPVKIKSSRFDIRDDSLKVATVVLFKGRKSVLRR